MVHHVTLLQGLAALLLLVLPGACLGAYLGHLMDKYRRGEGCEQ